MNNIQQKEIKAFFLSFLLLLAYWPVCQGQTNGGYSIEFDLATFNIVSTEVYEPELNINNVNIFALGKAEEIFYKYWKSNSFQEYQSLFLVNEIPDFTEGKFSEWRSAFKEVDLKVFGKVHLERRGFELVIFQFYIEDSEGKKLFQRPSFYKKYLGEYYSVSKEENMRFAGLKRFFGEVSARGINNIIDLAEGGAGNAALNSVIETTEAQVYRDSLISSGGLLEVISRLREGNTPEAVAALESLHPYYSYLKERNLQLLLAEKIPEFREYMDLIKIDQPVQSQIVGLLNQGEFVGAANKLKETQNAGSVFEYAQKIREIFGDETIRIWDSRTNSWK